MPQRDDVYGAGFGDIAPGALTLRAIRMGARVTLAVSGELDLATAGELEAAVLKLCTAGTRELVLDARRVSFLDSEGLRALRAAREVCRRQGCRFSLKERRRPVHLFELSGLAEPLDPGVETGEAHAEGLAGAAASGCDRVLERGNDEPLTRASRPRTFSRAGRWGTEVVDRAVERLLSEETLRQLRNRRGRRLRPSV
jgi:anti-sigma B factor antagonist